MRLLKICFYLSIMLSVVPITGFLVSGGSWRAAWRFTRGWLLLIGAMAAPAALVFLVQGLYALIT